MLVYTFRHPKIFIVAVLVILASIGSTACYGAIHWTSRQPIHSRPTLAHNNMAVDGTHNVNKSMCKNKVTEPTVINTIM